MKKFLFTGSLAILLLSVSCTKTSCPDFMEYPDCSTPSRDRFMGMYKGTSTLDNGNHAITLWKVQAGPVPGELSLSTDIILQLNPDDPREFTIKDRSFMGNNLYIRTENSFGFFDNNTVTMEFWADEGATVEPGEKLIHYSFNGTRQ
jgi:hypothetical protein